MKPFRFSQMALDHDLFRCLVDFSTTVLCFSIGFCSENSFEVQISRYLYCIMLRFCFCSSVILFILKKNELIKTKCIELYLTFIIGLYLMICRLIFFLELYIPKLLLLLLLLLPTATCVLYCKIF